MEQVFEYEFNGYSAFVIRPENPNGKWIWKTEFFTAFDQAERALLEKGYKVWLVYDCFYGAGFGTQEEFEKLVTEAVWVSFVRFKMAHDFNEWGNIFLVK